MLGLCFGTLETRIFYTIPISKTFPYNPIFKSQQSQFRCILTFRPGRYRGEKNWQFSSVKSRKGDRSLTEAQTDQELLKYTFKHSEVLLNGLLQTNSKKIFQYKFEFLL